MSTSRGSGKKRAHESMEGDDGLDDHSDAGSQEQAEGAAGLPTQDEIPDEQLVDDLNTPEAREKQKVTKNRLRTHLKSAVAMVEDKESGHEIFRGTMESIGQTFKDVTNPAIATQDAQVLKLMSVALGHRVKNLRTDVQNFDTDEFIDLFIKLFGKRALPNEDEVNVAGLIDWETTGLRLMQYSRRAPTMGFMYGPLSIEQKQRKLTKRARVERDETQRTAPTNINTDKLQDGTVKEAEKAALRALLIEATQAAEGGKLNLFKFFINPKSFSQTVENLFSLSFLIKDGLAAIEEDDEDGKRREFPIVFASEPFSIQDRQEGARTKQGIGNISMKEWEKYINCYDIRESIIPDRDNV